MQRDDVDQWLEASVEARKTYDPERIAALFSPDVDHRYHPYDEPQRGAHHPNRVFDNCFVIRFDGTGRCRELTEWYIERRIDPARTHEHQLAKGAS